IYIVNYFIWYKCSFKKHIDRQLNIRG
ncbi:hypothetical protein AE812_RS22165, partial [Escherichia coli]